MKRSQYNQNLSQSVSRVQAGSATKVAGQRSNKGSGFTLVELLVVMAIIGILVSMLAVAIGPVLTRVQEGAVTTELMQMDAAVQKFKADNGFFPPSFNADGINPAGSSAQLLPFLNLLSPNHREGTQMPGAATGTTRLDVWWANIGSNLDDRSSIVFWLSGVCANKQYPLTGNVGNNTLPVAFNANKVFVAGMTTVTDFDVPRTVFFDFKNAQLEDTGLDLSTGTSSVALGTGIRIYNTPYKNKKSDKGKSYFYRDSASYPANFRAASYPLAYYASIDINGTATDLPANPGTFQIYTFGQDGLAENQPMSSNATTNRDNLANFANGRVETFKWKETLTQ